MKQLIFWIGFISFIFCQNPNQYLMPTKKFGTNGAIYFNAGTNQLDLEGFFEIQSYFGLFGDVWFAQLDMDEKTDLVINATSVGIKKNEEIKLDTSKLNGQLFYDLIYNPPQTKFLENAKRSGKKIENGKSMFIYQAMKAFEIWHGIKPEINKEVYDLIK